MPRKVTVVAGIDLLPVAAVIGGLYGNGSIPRREATSARNRGGMVEIVGWERT